MKHDERHLTELISRYLDDQAEEQDVEELTEILQGDLQAQSHMARILNQHVTLRGLHSNTGMLDQLKFAATGELSKPRRRTARRNAADGT